MQAPGCLREIHLLRRDQEDIDLMNVQHRAFSFVNILTNCISFSTPWRYIFIGFAYLASKANPISISWFWC
jgi:hypothetical protein